MGEDLPKVRVRWGPRPEQVMEMSPEELDRYFKGMDVEASWDMAAPLVLLRNKSPKCILGKHSDCKGWTEPLPDEVIERCECSCHEKEA